MESETAQTFQYEEVPAKITHRSMYNLLWVIIILIGITWIVIGIFVIYPIWSAKSKAEELERKFTPIAQDIAGLPASISSTVNAITGSVSRIEGGLGNIPGIISEVKSDINLVKSDIGLVKVLAEDGAYLAKQAVCEFAKHDGITSDVALCNLKFPTNSTETTNDALARIVHNSVREDPQTSEEIPSCHPPTNGTTTNAFTTGTGTTHTHAYTHAHQGLQNHTHAYTHSHPTGTGGRTCGCRKGYMNRLYFNSNRAKRHMKPLTLDDDIHDDPHDCPPPQEE